MEISQEQYLKMVEEIIPKYPVLRMLREKGVLIDKWSPNIIQMVDEKLGITRRSIMEVTTDESPPPPASIQEAAKVYAEPYKLWNLQKGDAYRVALVSYTDGYNAGASHLSGEVERLKGSRKKVCYCGSLRVAKEAFQKAEYERVLRGEIALLPCCMFVDIQREYGAESDYKQSADDLHKRKIDICDEVFVLNVGGYIGESTRSEIDYALSIGKPVQYLESINKQP
jgi:hypothetical protein